MQIIDSALNGVLLLEPKVFEDHRGYFYESYNINVFKKLGIDVDFIQDNQSLSTEVGVIRGLHFQTGSFAQGKLVRVISGAVLDVAVDIRKGSPSYGQHYSAELTAKNKKLMYVPAGFAHGFAVLEPNTLFSYKCSNVYDKDSERGLAWDDPDLEIDWKIDKPILSEKDTQHPRLKDYDSPFNY